jgi:hypothetical protein
MSVLADEVVLVPALRALADATSEPHLRRSVAPDGDGF